MILAWLKRTFLYGSDDPLLLDHVPAGALDCRTPEKIEAARQKLGKPFVHEVRVSRMTPPSRQLDHINERTEAAKRDKATVTHIRRNTATTKE